MSKGYEGKAKTSLVLGIFCLLTAGLPISSLPLGIISLVLSGKGRKSEKAGLATSGMVLSIIGLSVCVVAMIVRVTSTAAELGIV